MTANQISSLRLFLVGFLIWNVQKNWVYSHKQLEILIVNKTAFLSEKGNTEQQIDETAVEKWDIMLNLPCEPL